MAWQHSDVHVEVYLVFLPLAGEHMPASLRRRWFASEALTELSQALEPGSRLCGQVPLLRGEINPAALLSALGAAGLQMSSWRVVAPLEPQHAAWKEELQFVACKP